jgi:hypothetical protein
MKDSKTSKKLILKTFYSENKYWNKKTGTSKICKKLNLKMMQN